MTVDTFDPSAFDGALDSSLVDELLALDLSDDQLPLDAAEAARFAGLVTHSDWPDEAPRRGDAELHKLARLFTVGEMQFATWQAGDKSAVVPIVRELKSRGAFASEDKRWIKAHTENRFLPNGNVMDRL